MDMVNLSMLIVLNILVGSTSRSITKMVIAKKCGKPMKRIVWEKCGKQYHGKTVEISWKE
jgi:hypothetical protein